MNGAAGARKSRASSSRQGTIRGGLVTSALRLASRWVNLLLI